MISNDDILDVLNRILDTEKSILEEVLKMRRDIDLTCPLPIARPQG